MMVPYYMAGLLSSLYLMTTPYIWQKYCSINLYDFLKFIESEWIMKSSILIELQTWKIIILINSGNLHIQGGKNI